MSQTVADQRVHPATIPLRFLKEVPSNLIGLPAIFAVVSDVGLGTVLLVAAAAGVATFVVNWLRWRTFRYGVGSGDIVIESGFLHRTRRSIPFHRIQDIDIEQRLGQRLFGLAKVRIETGGSGKDEGVLDSVSLAEADHLRSVLKQARGGAAPVAEAQAPDAIPIIAMPLGRVLLSGLFNFSLLYIAGLFAILQSFEPWLPFDIYDPGRWMGLIGADAAGRFSLVAIASVLVLAVALGVVTGVLRILARDYGFRLTLEEESRFRRIRGLFTRSQSVIARDRIQLALVTDGPVRRLFDGADLSFQTLSAGAEESGRQSVAPFSTTIEVEQVLSLAGAYRRPQASELRMVSRRHVLRVVLAELLVPLPLILIAALFWPAALLLLPLLALGALGAVVSRRFHLHGLGDGLLFVRKGFWRRRLWIVPAANVQAVAVTRTLLQRWLGLATLHADTAGAATFDYPRIVDIRHAEAVALAATLIER
ncbi:PH domain-containing protein [Sphingosinicella sp. LY1275]|uniref:PH domain-containing protein n=1 Tax=Sphingosinicella sp. LY1275 TaxID=3095379 RepID=UPI002ADEB5CB|nr:PH domain-containing protein [Sphingosinicella sp. LY1275]MEA1013074.1 PH domain-containing protein [Sphingosinicella sp. LY1275]